MYKHHTRLDLVSGGNIFKQGDEVTLGFIPRYGDGTVIDLTGKTIAGKIYSSRKGVIYEAPATYNSGTQTISFAITETLDYGEFQIEFIATGTDFKMVLPSDKSNGRIDIKPSSENMDYAGVSMTTVAQLKSELQGLQTEFAGQVLPRVDIVEDKQTQLEVDYQAAVGALTEDSEVILARKGEPTLRAFNDKVVAQLAETGDRIANIISTAGDGTVPTELLDIRFLNGVTYDTAAQAVRAVSEGKGLKEGAVSEHNTDFVVPGKNLFDKSKAVHDKYWTNLSEPRDLAGYQASAKFPVNPAYGNATIQNARTHLFFYADGNPITETAVNDSTYATKTVPIPIDARFMAVSTPNNFVDTMQVEYGEVATTPEPFILKFPKLDLNERMQKLEFSNDGATPVKVVKSGDTFTLTSKFDKLNDIVITVNAKGSANGSFNMIDTKIGAATVHITGDDITPIRTNIATVGANHGYTNVIAVTMVSHGKTVADLGSQWTDGTTVYTLLKIEGNVLTFGCPYTVTDGLTYSPKVVPVAPLTHVSGATNSGNVSITSMASSPQLYPSINKLKLNFLLDGKPLTDDDTYFGEEFQIQEVYDVMDYKAIIDYAQANIGSSFANENIEGIVQISNTFSYRKGLKCTTSHSLKVKKKVSFGRSGLLQSGPMAATGHTLRRYMPNVKVKSGIDMAAGVDMANYATSLYYSSPDYVDPAIPPNHYVDWLLLNGVKKYGFVLGYITDKTNSKNAFRAANTNIGWDMRNTKKSYPVGVEGLFEAGSYLSFSGFRNYLNPAEMGNATLRTIVEDKKDKYLYVDYNQAVTADSSPLIGDIGKRLEVVQSENLSVLNESVDTEGVVITTSNAIANTVIKIR